MTATTTNHDPNRLAFLQGVLAATAANGQVIHYDELRRLCRFSQQQLGDYLTAARAAALAAGQPDFSAVAVKETGVPGEGWFDATGDRDPAVWAQRLREVHVYWRDRRAMDNTEFGEEHGALPVVPGLQRP